MKDIGRVIDEKEIFYPIRLMFGISSASTDGFSVIYEKEDGVPAYIDVWFESKNSRKVRFIGEGQSRVVFTVKEIVCIEKSLSMFPPKIFDVKVQEKRIELKEILIRRDAQFPLWDTKKEQYNAVP